MNSGPDPQSGGRRNVLYLYISFHCKALAWLLFDLDLGQYKVILFIPSLKLREQM